MKYQELKNKIDEVNKFLIDFSNELKKDFSNFETYKSKEIIKLENEKKNINDLNIKIKELEKLVDLKTENLKKKEEENIRKEDGIKEEIEKIGLRIETFKEMEKQFENEKNKFNEKIKSLEEKENGIKIRESELIIREQRVNEKIKLYNLKV